MVQRFRRVAGLAVLLPFCTLGLAGQEFGDERVHIVPRLKSNAPDPESAAQTMLRVNSTLVLIPAHVTTAAGSPVNNLQKENFALFEDGVPQTITHFAQDDAAVSVGVLLDTSGSMKNKMARVSAAATEFFRFANPDDEFFLVEFNGRAKLTIPFTRDWREISWKIERSKPSGMTALLDAIHLAVAQMKHARNARKAVVVLSDGGENYSRRSLRELRNALLESEVQVYAMCVFDSSDPRKRTAEEQNGPQLLNEVALETGGQEFPVLSLDELSVTGVEIARHLRNQYILGYSPTNFAADGKYRRVTLKLTLPGSDLRAYYRHGYYAPPAAGDDGSLLFVKP